MLTTKRQSGVVTLKSNTVGFILGGFISIILLWNQLRYSTRCMCNEIIVHSNNNNSYYDHYHHDPSLLSLSLSSSIQRMEAATYSTPTNTSGGDNWIPLQDLLNTDIEKECPKNLVLVTDKFLPTPLSTIASSYLSDYQPLIPRIIHVTSKSRCMTKEFVDNLQKWKNLDNYMFVVHNDAAVERLLQYVSSNQYFPMLQHVLHCAVTPAAKVDIWRAIVLYQYGGIYTDIDNAPGEYFFQKENISTTSEGGGNNNNIIIQNTDQSFFVVEEGGFLSQYFMASIPKHPLMWQLVHQCIIRLLDVQDVERQYVPFVTGPGALKSAFQRFMNVPTLEERNNSNVTKTTATDQNTYGRVTSGIYTSPIHTNTTVTVAGRRSRPNDIIARNVIYKKRNIYKKMNMTHFSRYQITKDTPKQTCLQRIYQKTISTITR